MGKFKKLTATGILHYYRLIFRSALFIAALILYIIYESKNPLNPFGGFEDNPYILGAISLVFLVEMILRFFPSKLESMGCQKQFKKNFLPTEAKEKPYNGKGVLWVALFWIGLNAVIGILFYLGFLTKGILILIALLYSVCDMICILFFCPFQQWTMKNKCCGSCRIYNWDYAMMFTPLIFIDNPFTVSLVICSVLLLIRWEVGALLHPEYFSEKTNCALSCKNCKEKLCSHKTALKTFLKNNKELFKHIKKPSSN